MISEKALKTQVKRLLSLPFTPTERETAQTIIAEFQRVLKANCANDLHLEAVVTRVIDEQVRCPAPAVLIEAARAVPDPQRRDPQDPGRSWEKPPCPYGECDGSGWIHLENPVFSMVKMCRCRSRAGAA